MRYDRATITSEIPHPGVHYAWIVLAVTFVCLLTAAAVRSLPGILTHALEAEFGWDRTAVALAVSSGG